MLIYKIFRDDEWRAFEAAGETEGAPVDLADGFIHFSTAAQAAETAARHFAGADGLWLLAFDAEALGAALKWEPSRGGALFPHLFRPLRRAEMLWAEPLPLVDGLHRFPDQSEFDLKMQRAEIDFLRSNAAAQNVFAQNYVGLPY